MRGLLPVFKRELIGYFITPVAYVFIVIFLVLAGVFTFQIGGWYEANQADLRVFFNAHPWLYMFLIPALSMRLWAEERKSGTIELLLTLPVSRGAAVLGKFLAAWAFTIMALALTAPLWITVNYLSMDNTDNMTILAGYLGSALMAGGFLAIGAAVSASTKSQVIAFIITIVICFLFLLAGYSPVLDFFKAWAPEPVVETIAGFSFLTRFESIGKGLLDLRDIVYFGTLIAACLAANLIIVEAKKAA